MRQRMDTCCSAVALDTKSALTLEDVENTEIQKL